MVTKDWGPRGGGIVNPGDIQNSAEQPDLLGLAVSVWLDQRTSKVPSSLVYSVIQ